MYRVLWGELRRYDWYDVSGLGILVGVSCFG